jgi:Immunoglobulin domain
MHFTILEFLFITLLCFFTRSAVLPQIMPFSFGDESINAGDLISVQCAVTKGDTPISMSWLFNGTEMLSTEDILISKNSKKVSALTIESVRASHMGEYTCIAKNAAGASNFSTKLHINGHYSNH